MTSAVARKEVAGLIYVTCHLQHASLNSAIDSRVPLLEMITCDFYARILRLSDPFGLERKQKYLFICYSLALLTIDFVKFVTQFLFSSFSSSFLVSCSWLVCSFIVPPVPGSGGDDLFPGPGAGVYPRCFAFPPSSPT